MNSTIRRLVLVVSLLVFASAVAGAGAAVVVPLVVSGEQARWAMFGFEVVCAVAAALGVLVGLGRYASGPGLALACIAGTILVASRLGWQAGGRQIAGVSLSPLLAARGAAGLALGLAGIAVVLGRRPGAWRTAFIGGLLILPVAAGAVALLVPAGRQAVGSWLGTSPAFIFGVAVVAFLGATALLAAGVHLVIRAFEMGRTEEPTSRSA
jgi:hypothetical protein